MEMQGKKDVKERDARDAFRNRHPKISRIGGRILEATEIVLRAVLFVVIVLAIELAVWGIVSLACGRW